jgi:signal transduction histidine kinase
MFKLDNDRVRTQNDRTEKVRQTAASQFGEEPAGPHEEDAFDPIQLLEVAAHDLRNPISGIMAAGQYLLDDAGYLLDEQHLALLQSIEASSRSMLGLIDDVIELSRIESGKLRLDIQSTDLLPLMNRALLQNQTAAERKKVGLDVQANGGALLPPVDVDPVRIFHAFDSLISQTIKLAKSGSRIEIGVGARSGRAIISLGTDGCGISAAGLRTLFHPFRKGRSVTPGVQGGTAMAFAKTKRIIEAHGGVMGVQSGEGKEWAIKVTLPLPHGGIMKRAIAHKGAAGAP